MKKKDTYFVVGISTEVGKTIVSAILTEALEADYWKPIQSGDLDNSDTDKVLRLTHALFSTPIVTPFIPLPVRTFQLN